MRTFMVLGTILACSVALPAMAQPKLIKPGPEHEFLKQGVGVWDATVKAGGGEIKGELHVKMAPGDLWMLENFKMTGVPFEGYGATSYDATKKKYVNVWIDSMVPTPMVSEGTYDKEKKTLTLVGNMTDTEGKMKKATITITYKNADSKVLSIATEGKDSPMIEIAYKRRVAEKK
jgi:hypothetical protein